MRSSDEGRGEGRRWRGSDFDRGDRDMWTSDDLGYNDRGYGYSAGRYGMSGGGYGDRYGGGYYGTQGRGAGGYRDDYNRGGDYDRDYDNRRGFMDRAGDEVASWFGDEDAARRRRMDQHRGKGPRGYTRSDSRIEEDVNDRLSDDPYLDASDIEVKVSNAEVTLSGHVSSRQDKRRAEDCAEAISGVSNVQNNLRVKTRNDSDWAKSQTGTSGSNRSTSATGSTGSTSTTTGATGSSAGTMGSTGSMGRSTDQT
ncbi:BON domain-containing protein [Mycoplana sp. BE70]|uniref:BON domain-containing protein n=1 Tax=Mycoplana sp. BE70 TaxID=2817775 RepID=UPI00286B5DA3|nr:BON domain-containing protein [Mycoplana sp. BE70]